MENHIFNQILVKILSKTVFLFILAPKLSRNFVKTVFFFVFFFILSIHFHPLPSANLVLSRCLFGTNRAIWIFGERFGVDQIWWKFWANLVLSKFGDGFGEGVEWNFLSFLLKFKFGEGFAPRVEMLLCVMSTTVWWN